MSSKFFTNRDRGTLSNRFNDILEHSEIESAKFLIGYFRVSGFSKIAKFIDRIKRVRILIGLSSDKLTYLSTSLLDFEKVIDSFKKEQLNYLQSAEYRLEVEEGIRVLIKLLKEKKLEIKISKDRNIHSKIYIFKEREIVGRDGKIQYRGSVVTGSSNLSANGLERNFEFNVELRDSDDIEFALNEFNRLWSEAVELSADDIDSIKKSSYIHQNELITPYELYIKFLIEYFDDRVEIDTKIEEILPKNFKKLRYQIDAITQAISMLRRYSGFFLSDVVGLGKTITTTMIVKRALAFTDGEILIITPPSIRQEWEESFEKFKIGSSRNYQIVTTGTLSKIKSAENFEVVIVDESHKFRNHQNRMYENLQRICKIKFRDRAKKVILISATPFNNRPQDIANQLYLFQDKRNSTIESFKNLEHFFAKISRDYENLKKLSSSEQRDSLQSIAKQIRNLISNVMVRRTRRDLEEIQSYREDLKSQNITFPKVITNTLNYELKLKDAQIFDLSADILTKKLKYARFMARAYLKEDKKREYERDLQSGFTELSSNALAKLMQSFLIKRFESSIYAFRQSTLRQRDNLNKFIDMLKNGRVYIGKDLDISKYEDINDIERDLEKIKDIKAFESSDFENSFIKDLESDLNFLNELIELWEEIEEDRKLIEFKNHIDSLGNKKVVIFTESKESSEYLKKSFDRDDILLVHGSQKDKLKPKIRENFDANYRDKKDDFNIIITTDVLAEGVNLHRANIIYNYDIPWNSTRLMQRVGRVNRIGTEFKEIFVYNFEPSAKSEEIISLSKRTFQKLQTFHSTLGEDNPVYSENESVNSYKMFKEEFEGERDEELIYLEELREFKARNPKKFQELKNLPDKIRVQREPTKLRESTALFLKRDYFKSYYLKVQEDILAISFLEMADILKAPKSEQALRVSDRHFEDVESILNFHSNQKSESNSRDNSISNSKTKNKNDSKAIKSLKEFIKKGVNKEIAITLIKTIESGKFLNLSKEIIDTQKRVKAPDEMESKLKELIQKYALKKEERKDREIELDSRANLILSESF